MMVNAPFMTMLDDMERSPTTYMPDDTVRLRISSMSESMFNYWSDYDDIVALSSNPFFPVNKKIRSNISSGMGYWAGYGSSYYRVSIADSLARGRVWPSASE